MHGPSWTIGSSYHEGTDGELKTHRKVVYLRQGVVLARRRDMASHMLAWAFIPYRLRCEENNIYASGNGNIKVRFLAVTRVSWEVYRTGL